MSTHIATFMVTAAPHTHTHPFNGPLSRTTQVSRYEKVKTNLDFTEARDSEWQWHQLGHMQACTSLQTDDHASTPPLSFLQAGCASCRPTNSVKALKATSNKTRHNIIPEDAVTQVIIDTAHTCYTVTARTHHSHNSLVCSPLFTFTILWLKLLFTIVWLKPLSS